MQDLTQEQQEQFVKAAQEANYLGFITTLARLGKPVQTKQASEDGTPVIAQAPFTEEEVRWCFQKYAKEWLPHRQQLTAGYLNAILGGEQEN